jgi:hypothetical protein
MRDFEPGQGAAENVKERGLPEFLRPFFWDCDFDRLRWEEYRDFITGRILISGNWETLRWLRRRIGDEGVRSWIRKRRGRGLSPQQLRFWELILDLSKAEVDRWLAAQEANPWTRRLEPKAAVELA